MKTRSLRCIVSALALATLVMAAGCASQPKSVKIDAPRLAFALMFVGACAVLCSSIGGFCLVRASKRRKED
jgi:hypothetical protein